MLQIEYALGSVFEAEMDPITVQWLGCNNVFQHAHSSGGIGLSSASALAKVQSSTSSTKKYPRTRYSHPRLEQSQWLTDGEGPCPIFLQNYSLILYNIHSVLLGLTACHSVTSVRGGRLDDVFARCRRSAQMGSFLSSHNLLKARALTRKNGFVLQKLFSISSVL
jgi:hypothetical protein